MIPMSVLAILATAVAHFFWQPYCDRKEGLLPQGGGERIQMDLSALKKAPTFYMILPFLPIAGMLIFDGKITIARRGGGALHADFRAAAFTSCAVKQTRKSKGRDFPPFFLERLSVSSVNAAQPGLPSILGENQMRV